MKKLIMFFVLLMAIPLAIFAQDPTTPPTGWGDILMNPSIWFASLAGIALLTAFLTALFNGWLKITKPFVKQLIAWAVAIILTVLSDLFNFGYAKDFTIVFAIVNGFAAGLAANGVFDIPILKAILDKIEGWFPPKPVPPIN